MTDLDFGHIKRICESDAGHGMTKTALIHWVLGSIAEVEQLRSDMETTSGRDHAKVERLEAEREGKHPARGDYVERAKFRDTIAKQAHAEGMEAAVGICRRWDDEWMLDCGCASTIADKIAAAKETT